MRTLNKIYSEISENDSRWSYYQTPPRIYNAWKNDEDAFNFIKEYFDISGKSHVFKDSQIQKYERDIKKRACHIVSTFLLGIKLAECFHINTYERDATDFNFKYYYFLSCLYHDIGYVYENHSRCGSLKMLQTDGLDAIQEICNIKYLHNRVFKTYSRDDVDIYLKGRATCSNGQKGTIDHGIIGGLLLYDRLRKQFEIAWKHRTDKQNTRESFHIKNECTCELLHLSNSHYEKYAMAADAIIAHNIWTSTLAKLKNTNNQPIQISINNPIAFILSIADTFEPLKKDVSLDDVYICEAEQGFIISANREYFCKLEQAIKDIGNWINVEVDGLLPENEVHIKLK